MSKRVPVETRIFHDVDTGEITRVDILARIKLDDETFPDEYKQKRYRVTRAALDLKDSFDLATDTFLSEIESKMIAVMKREQIMPDDS